MFDGGLGGSGDAAVVAAITDSARQEAQAAARRLAAIAELVARRCPDDERAHWACDDWDAAAAEVSAALGITHGRASAEMLMAMSLRHRLPRVAALFTEGALSYRVCQAIVDRTYLVQDHAVLAVLDRAIADDALTWGPMSALKLQRAIDAWVDRYDPGALRRTQSRLRDRDIVLDLPNAHGGVADIRGSLLVTDAAALDRRLSAMAHAVCDDDPRTLGQRRSDALGALGAGSEHLACTCDNPDCPATAPDARAATVVVHVLTDADTDDPVRESRAGGVLTGTRGIVPAPLLTNLITTGATIRPLRRPSNQPEPGYRPSTALDDFIRMRDLT
ncbi:DUF222 domain-containing protein, partial [Mycobacterium sp. shizuoka-1]|uniref:DUF222 domain-containing protein n=1 Tax=Mycobacterium sp. shizuoka-1 TaxID=2039281 RepID=UPI001E2CF9A0